MSRRGWKPFVAPAAFLLAITIGVLAVRGALYHRSGETAPPARVHQAPAKHGAPAARHYTVKAGDTLSAIAVKTGVPLARIRLLNPSLEPTALFIGEKIRLR